MEGKAASFLVEDGVEWLDKLIDDLRDEIKTELDYLVILLHSFLIELGFSNTEGGIHPCSGWKSSNEIYILKYSLPPATTSTCQLIVTRLGQSVLKVHGIHLPDKTTFTLSTLKISQHVKTVNNKFIPTNLRHLSRSFKNSVGLPLLQASRSHLGLTTSGLLGLPPEVLLNLLHFLPINAIINTSLTCKQLNNATDDQSMWKRLCSQDFPGKKGEDWRETYKKEYTVKKREKEAEELRNRGAGLHPFAPRIPHPFEDPDADMGPGRSFLPPGIVGGDYDRFPIGGGLGPLGGGFGPLGGGPGGLGPLGGGPGGIGPLGGGPGPFGQGRGPRFDPPGPNFPNMGQPGGFGRGNPGGFGGGGFGFM